MPHAVPSNVRHRHGRPFRGGAFALVWILAAGIAADAFAHGDQAHARADATAPAAAATQYAGTVETLTVVDRATGRTWRYPRLLLDDGRRVNLEGVAAPAEGTYLGATGRLEGHRLQAESVRPLGQTTNAAPAADRTRTTLAGTLHVFHIDYPDGTDDYGYTLRAASGRQNVVALGRPPESIDNGARAIVSGTTDARGYITVDTIEITGEPAAPLAKSTTTGDPAAATRGYTVFPLKYPSNTASPWTYNADPGSWSIASITNAVFGNGTGSAADYYKEVSFGAQLLSGVVANAAGTWLQATQARPTACGTSAQLDAVLSSIESNGQAAATAAGFNPNANDGQLYILDALPCSWSGLGYIGHPLAYAKGTASLIVVGHEIGHNFGLYHAGSLNCGSEVVASSGCTVAEYGDPFDIMGNRRAMHFNARQKERLGYLGPNGVTTHASGTSTYTLYPIELGGQARYAVRVAPSGTTRTYWIEFRQPIGFDAPLSSMPNLGAQIRLAYPFENQCSGCDSMSDDTQFLDMTRGTTSFDDGALLAGKSFTDTFNNITISVLAASSTSLDVQVSTGGTSPAATTTTLASSANPSTQGQSVTFTATVTGTAPTGSVTFKDGVNTIAGCSAVALAGSGNTRSAACATSSLATGVHGITAQYAGDAGNAASTSAQVMQTVNSSVAASTTTLTSAPNPATQGQGVTLTATVSGNAPTGTVAFKDGAATVAGCSAVALTGNGSARTATCTTSSLAVGSHAMTAQYSGDAGNAPSTSAQLTQTINAAIVATATVLASSQNPSTQGQSVTFTATVTGTAPTGSVTFKDGTSTLAGCSAVALSGNGNSRAATCTSSSLATGSHAVTAQYSGGAGNAASTSATLTQTVNAVIVTTTTTLASSANPVTEGQVVTFTATVTGAAPTGTVAFKDGAATIGSCNAVALAGSGNARTASCSTASLTAGSHVVSAQYAGDAGNAASTSAGLTQTVNGAGGGGPVFAATTTALASSANPSMPGQSVTFTATVDGVSPTGTVAFRDGNNAIPTCGAVTLSGSGNARTASCTTAALSTGSHSIAAQYSGDAANAPSTSSNLAQSVLPSGSAISTAVTLTSSANPAPSTGAVTLTATIHASTPVPAGTVTFVANGSTITGCGNVSVVTSGTTRIAQCTTQLATGAFTIVATYNGSGQYQPSSSLPFAQVKSLPGLGNTIQFAAADYEVNENAGSVTVTVTRIGDATAAAVASYATVSGTATSAEFEAAVGTLTWAAQDATPRTITIPILDEVAHESNETFAVKLTAATGATLGAVATTTVTVVDNETAPTAMPPTATVVQNPYGALTVIGAAFNGTTLSNPTRNVDIELGPTPGTAGSMLRIDFQNLSIGPGNTLRIRSGAAGQTVMLVNVSADMAAIAGSVVAIQGNGAPPPALVVKSAPGVTVAPSGRIATPSGLTIDSLDAGLATGMPLLNQGTIHGGPVLTLKAARVNGGGIFRANAMTFVTFGNLNNPVNGAHYLANGLQLHPATGNTLAVTVAGYGTSPQVYNLMLNGNGIVSMPSSWPAGSALPLNNRPVLPNEVRAAGVPDPSYGGGQVIVQASGSLTLDGGVSGDFVFPGGFVLRANGAIDTRGTTLVNGWTTSGTTYQGIFLEAPSIVDSSGAPALDVFTNDLNWANFSVRPALPVQTATLRRQGDGTARYAGANTLAPHLNFYGLVTEAGAAGKCYTCLVNTTVMDLTTPP